MSMPRNNQPIRVLSILIRLCAFQKTGLTIKELMEYADVDRRTLYRDFDAIKAAGVELESTRNSGSLRIRIARIPGLIED